MSFVASAPDPYRVSEFSGFGYTPGYDNRDGRTLVSPALVAGENTAILVVAGQSNACNHDDTLYTPVSTKAQNLNLYNGGIYQAKDPLLGAEGTGGCWAGRLADKLITAGTYDRVILAPIAVGGTTVGDWHTTLADRLPAIIRRISSLGLPITAFLWGQGEQDASNTITEAAYLASLQAVIQTTRDAGSAAPWFVALETHPNTTSKTAVRAAQAAVVDSVSIFQGPDMDTLTGLTNRQGDDTHLTAVGSDAAAGLWKTAIEAVL